MNPSERLKEIELRAVKLPNGKHLAVADSAVTEWLIQRVKTLEAALETIACEIGKGDCDEFECCRARKALEGDE